MTEPKAKAIPGGMHTITPHIVVRDAARAVEWYKTALGAEERSRVPLPGGKLMSVELWFGDSAVMVADEFPEMGIVSPQTLGGTPTVLNLLTEDVDALWKRAVEAGAEVLHPPAGRVLGRPSRAAHRSVRPPLGARPAPARRPAGGDCACRSRGVRQLIGQWRPAAGGVVGAVVVGRPSGGGSRHCGPGAVTPHGWRHTAPR